MFKFKVGDKVRVRRDLCEEKIYHREEDSKMCIVAVSDMIKFAGKIVTIDKILGDKYCIKECGYHYWTDEMFESPDRNRKILITTDGTATTAKLYDGKRLIKEEKAICSPDDTFDFSKGAELVFDRLLKGRKPEEPEIKAGDFVRVTGDTTNHGFPIGSIVLINRAYYPDEDFIAIGYFKTINNIAQRGIPRKDFERLGD